MSKLNLSTTVSIAEIISSLAVVVSLIYVGYEFKRSEKVSNKEADNIIYEKVQETNRLLVENADLAGIILKTVTNPDGLTSEEKIRYLAFEHIFYDTWESAWNYNQAGIFDNETWQTWNDWFIKESNQKSIMSWEGNRRHYGGEFLKYIDRLLLK